MTKETMPTPDSEEKKPVNAKPEISEPEVFLEVDSEGEHIKRKEELLGKVDETLSEADKKSNDLLDRLDREAQEGIDRSYEESKDRINKKVDSLMEDVRVEKASEENLRDAQAEKEIPFQIGDRFQVENLEGRQSRFRLLKVGAGEDEIELFLLRDDGPIVRFKKSIFDGLIESGKWKKTDTSEKNEKDKILTSDKDQLVKHRDWPRFWNSLGEVRLKEDKREKPPTAEEVYGNVDLGPERGREFESEDELSVRKAENFKKTNTFDELFKALDELGEVYSAEFGTLGIRLKSKKHYSAEEIKTNIKEVRAGTKAIIFIPEEYGLRDKVSELLDKELATKGEDEAGYSPAGKEINEIIKEHLSFQDGEFTKKEKKKMLSQAVQSERTKKYANALLDAKIGHGWEKVERIVKDTKEKLGQMLEKLGIPVDQVAKSESWAFGDYGKQFYYFNHPEEAGGQYSTEDPFASTEIQKEILDRNLGWEAYLWYRATRKGKQFVKDLKSTSFHKDIVNYLKKPPKQDNMLSPEDLVKLGGWLREAIAEKEAKKEKSAAT